MRIRSIPKFSVTLLALLSVVLPCLTVPVGTRYAYLDWTGGLPRTGVRGLRVAIVKPVFTHTAYSWRLSGVGPVLQPLFGPLSFYDFYDRHKNDSKTQAITTDLNLLNVSVIHGWGWSGDLGRYITSVMSDYGLGITTESFTILSDIDVTQGSLFNQDNSSRFDVVVLGFTEYVTSQEYYGYQRFVALGGRLIIMDASNFVAEVKYYPQTDHVALVWGHGWRLEGGKVWRDDDHFIRWKDENANWVGSNEIFFHDKYVGANVTGDYPISVLLKQRFGPVVFRSYTGHEENGVANMTDTIILARWLGVSASSGNNIATYLHRYLNGTVIDIGVMSSDVVDQDTSVQFFLLSSIVDSTRTQS